MQQREGNIDESIKVNSWGSEPPLLSPTGGQHHTFFQHYAAQRSPPPPPPPSFNKNYSQLESQQIKELSSLDHNFSRLKNEQIQKLRTLRNEYAQIKKITTAEYAVHRVQSESESLRSSNANPSSVDQKQRAGPSGRQYQIMELQRKQLQIMLQNSMKKIEELLHNEMQYKKTIHQLRLQKQSKNYQEIDVNSYGKIIKKKEREHFDQIRVLQLQRETLISNLTGLKEKVKYLQSKLIASDQQLRKMLEQKRNYEELIRMQKDKLLNLQIEYRREKRQAEIMQKDKNAQINMLLKERDLKQSSNEKQLRNLTSSLQEELKLKEKRYNLLLQQLDSIKQQKQKEEKDQEVKLVQEILNKNGADAPSKALQDTIGSILNRLNELEMKPSQNLVQNQLLEALNSQHQEEEERQRREEREYRDTANDSAIQHYKEYIEKLENKLLEYQRKMASLKTANQILQGQNTSIKTELETLQRKNKILYESDSTLREQLQKMKIIQRKMSTTSSREVLHPIPHATVQDSSQKYQFLSLRIKNLQKQIASLSVQLEESHSLLQKVEDQNRELLNQTSRAQFQMTKTKQEADFQLSIAKKSHQTNYSIILQDLQIQKAQHAKAQQQIANMRIFIREHMQAGRRQIEKLNFKIEALQRQKNSFDLHLKTTYNGDVQRIKGQYKGQIDKLTSEVKDLNIMNTTLQERYNRSQYLVNQNEELKHSMKNMRLEQSYHNPSRDRERELDLDGDIMASLAQNFGGKAQNTNQNVSYHDSNIINSIFGGGFGK